MRANLLQQIASLTFIVQNKLISLGSPLLMAI